MIQPMMPSGAGGGGAAAGPRPTPNGLPWARAKSAKPAARPAATSRQKSARRSFVRPLMRAHSSRSGADDHDPVAELRVAGRIEPLEERFIELLRLRHGTVAHAARRDLARRRR